MEGPTSPYGLRNRITRLTLHEHDDDDDDKFLIFKNFVDVFYMFLTQGFFSSIIDKGKGKGKVIPLQA
jgi:hypothetical protein